MAANKPCPKCREVGHDSNGDHLFLMQDGITWTCLHGSKYHEAYMEREDTGDYNPTQSTNNKISLQDVSALVTDALTDRSISKEAAERYGVKVAYDPTTGEIAKHYYPYYRSGDLVGYKERSVTDKKFFGVGSLKGVEMFGQNLTAQGGLLLIVTEGECDAMAAFDLLKAKGKDYSVVSLPHGASTAAVKQHLEYLESFQKVVFMLDQDEPGIAAAKECIELLSPGKGRLGKLSEKDANDMLRALKVDEFYRAINSASAIVPDGIIRGSDTWERVKNRPKIRSLKYPDHWVGLNKMTYGIRLGELDTWTSGSGSGKTQFLRELQYHIITSTEDSVGIIALEEPLEDSVDALISLKLNKRIHLEDVRETISDDDYYQAWLETSGTDRVHFYDYFGSDETDRIVAKIRYFAKGLGCKYIFLDHLSIAVSEFASEGDERKNIDVFMTKLKRLTQELGIWIGLVVHLRKSSGKPFEEGGVPSVDDLRGSGSIKQLSNSVIATARNQQHPDDYCKNTSSVHVLKCRYTGSTGHAGWLHFDGDTGRLVASDDPEKHIDQDSPV